MNPETITDFLTGYIHSLSEETRKEKRGPRHGFDHIIYEIALAENEVPTRLSFFREASGELSKPKKEPEHGIDLAFLSPDRTRLTIFILKAEPLTYRNWTEKKFDYDMRRARDQNLTKPEFNAVTEVRLVLAYNKDDAAQGVAAFENFVGSSGFKTGDNVALTFERWNLTTLTEKVRGKPAVSLACSRIFLPAVYLHLLASWRFPAWISSVERSPSSRLEGVYRGGAFITRERAKRASNFSLSTHHPRPW